MNCTVCGNPLLFDRVALNCSCGAFVHAYCWDEHVLEAHRPPFEIGAVNLDGEFVPRESKVEVAVSDEQVLDTSVSEISATEEEEASEVVAMENEASEPALPEPEDSKQQASEEQTAETQTSEEQSPEEQTTPIVE